MHSRSSSDPIFFDYRIASNERADEFRIELDRETLCLKRDDSAPAPEWTALENNQCPNCTLKADDQPNCPIAVNIAPLIDSFRERESFEEVDVTIETAERTYSRRTSLQKAVSAMLGIYMVTCGCPVMEKLKPMVRFHLPFASLEETEYRVLSMYMLAQYFKYREGKDPDWDLSDLVSTYEGIQTLNKSFCKRLSDMKVKDASLNAVVILNTFADSVPFKIREEKLGRVRRLFDAYLG